MARELPPHIASRTVAEMRRLANEADAVTVQALFKTGVVLAHARPIFDDLEALAVALALAHATYTPLRASTESGLSTRSSVSRVTGLPRETVRRRIARLIDACHVIETRDGLYLAPSGFIALTSLIPRPQARRAPVKRRRNHGKRVSKT